MTTVIVSFLVLGALFGLSTYSNRHRFSEGPTRSAEEGPRDPLDGLLMWVLISSCLWPILVLTGAYSYVRVTRVRARAAASRPVRR